MARQRRVATVVGAVLGTVLALLLTVAESHAAVTEEFHQVYPLNPGGRVELRNVNGNVQISAWDRNEVKVNAVKRAGNKQRLDEARIVVEANADRIAIHTEYPDNDLTFTSGDMNNPASVEYVLTVPRGARLDRIELVNGGLEISGVTGEVRASCVNGRLAARDLQGDSRLSTVNNRVEVSFSRMPSSRIALKSVNGAVELTIPSDANAEVTAKTVNGSIDNDFGLHVHHGRYIGHDMRGQIGSGGPRIELDNVNGRIAIRHASDGRPLSPVKSLSNGDDDEI